MIDWIAAMRSWAITYGESIDMRPWLVFKEGRRESLKRSARIEWDDPDVMGHIIVWETGECEIDLGSSADASQTMIETRGLSREEDISSLMRDALAFYGKVVSDHAD